MRKHLSSRPEENKLCYSRYCECSDTFVVLFLLYVNLFLVYFVDLHVVKIFLQTWSHGFHSIF